MKFAAVALLFATLSFAIPLDTREPEASPCIPDDPTTCGTGVAKREPEPVPEPVPCVVDDPTPCATSIPKREPEPLPCIPDDPTSNCDVGSS